MTASWEPTRRANVQGLSSSLRNILKRSGEGERGVLGGGRKKSKPVRRLAGRDEGGARGQRGKTGRKQSHRNTGLQSVTLGKEIPRCNHQQP
jgi:hypothetical protein